MESTTKALEGLTVSEEVHVKPADPEAHDDNDAIADQHLPIDIMLALLPFLDPSSFIALSQTCRFYRRQIAPDRYHFLQRLLHLELQPAIGGPIPTVDAHGIVVPPVDDETPWLGMRYACAGCMKLLSQREFSNHALLNLRTRKPPAHADAAHMLAQPGDVAQRQRRRQHAEGTRLQSVRRFHASEPPGRDPQTLHLLAYYSPVSGDRHQDYERFVVEVAGSRRDTRLCAECAWRKDGTDPFWDYPRVRTRWTSSYALAKGDVLQGQYIRVLGHTLRRCLHCERWREAMGFFDEAFHVDHPTLSSPSQGRADKCWNCRHRAELESGAAVLKRKFSKLAAERDFRGVDGWY